MFITYKTTCLITGNYYIGSHKVSKEAYYGSGKLLQESINTYGVDNHVVEILGTFKTREESIELEHKLVMLSRKTDPEHLLNKTLGGYCFDKVNSSGKNVYVPTEEIVQQRLASLARGRVTQLKLAKDPEYSAIRNNNVSVGLTEYYKTHEGTFKGKHHKDSTKQIISEKAKIYTAGKNNSQYGTFWITDGVINKKWKLDYGDIPIGFQKGRVMKNNAS